MSNRRKTQKKYFSDKISSFRLAGIHDFRKSLERDFFADADIICIKDDDCERTNLIVNLECNFDLTDCLFHLQNGVWGGFLSTRHTTPNFEKAFQTLLANNHQKVDITELSINLRDTSLIVTQIYPYSISDYLGAILQAVNTHFVHFTKNLTEMPFEIFLPVFIEQTMTMGSSSTAIRTQQSASKGYFDYWALYFESNVDKDASIYDVRNKNLIDGDFFLIED